MTDHVFIIDAGQPRKVGDTIELTGAESRHAVKVRRVAPGERVDVVDGVGTRYACEVVDASMPESLALRVCAIKEDPTPIPRITIVQALLKGDRGERAVELMTEVGVDRIVPWVSERTIVRWNDDKARKNVERWRSIARESAKQARRSRVPVIDDVMSTVDVCEVIRSSPSAFVADENSTQDLPTNIASEDVLVVVGPEGGISASELSEFVAGGARSIRLGPTVLRGSTAGAIAATLIASRSPRWNGA